MSYENLYEEDFEDNQIKGVSELKIDITKCSNILTEDLKFTVYYDDNNLLVVNNLEKTLISKKIFTKKIEKIKVYPKNFISYLLNDDEGSTIITTHIDCIEDNLEMKRPFRIVDYLIFNFLAPLEFYLYLNSNGDIHFCRNAEIISRNTNILRDVNIDRNIVFKVEDICKIFYSEETQNLLFFFFQGKMLYYYIDTSAFEPYDNQNFNNNISKQQQSILIYIGFSTLIKLDILQSSAQSDYCEITTVRTFGQQSTLSNIIDYYLIVGFNHSKVFDKIKVFFFIKAKLELVGNYKSDPINAYRLEALRSSIHNANSFNFLVPYKGKIDDLNLFDLILFNSNFALNQKLSQKFPNLILYVMKSKNEGNFYFYISSLKNFLIKNVAVEPEYFSNFILDGKVNSILNLSTMGIFNNDFTDKNIDFSKFCVSIRTTYAKNKNQVYVLDDILLNDDIKTEKKNIRNYDYNMIAAMDPLDYFEFYQKIVNEFNELANFELNFKNRIIDLFKFNLYIDDIQLSSFEEINSIYKFDLYLACLIFSNDYLAIKNYLSIMDPKKEDFPFVNNEKLFFTVKIMYTKIIEEIITKQQQNFINPKFFSNTKLLEVLRTLSKLLYVNKSRAENSIFKPYNLEKEILVENSNAISQLIEKVESTITIVKIYKCISSGKNKLIDFSAFEKHNFPYFYAFVALVFPKVEKQILPEINLFYTNYLKGFLDLQSKEDIDNPFYIQDELNLVLKNSIYVSKFLLFFVFSYYSILSEVLKLTENNQAVYYSLILTDKNLSNQIKSNITSLFKSELSEEINCYFDLVFSIFLLDYNSNLKSNQIYSEMNIKTNLLSDLILVLNKENYSFSHIIGSASTFNSSFLANLIKDENFQEALVISKCIIPYYKEYEELLCQLKIFMHMDLLNMGFQFINDCFAFLIKLPSANYNYIFHSETSIKKFFEEFKKDDNFLILTSLYQEFFKFLIKNNKIELLFNLPLNIIERYILKLLILSEGKLEHLIILYYMKIKNIHAAEISFNDIKSSGNIDEENFNIYAKFIKAMKFIFGKKDPNLPDEWVNEGVDSQFFGSANKDYKMGIYFRNNNNLFKGKVLINKPSNLNSKSEDKMDVVDNAYEASAFGRNQNFKNENFEKIYRQIG
jgi:hypothetical protein